MFKIIGTLVVIVSVIGGYFLAGGFFNILFQPVEIFIIVGAAVGAFVAGNPLHVVTGATRVAFSSLNSMPYTRKHYLRLLSFLLILFTDKAKRGDVSFSRHAEEPDQSFILQLFPELVKDQHTMNFILEAVQLMTSAPNIDASLINKTLSDEIAAKKEQTMEYQRALADVAASLPGFGIVAAVLGIVITMGYVDQDTVLVAEKMGGALVGTFLGVFLSYGIFNPMAMSVKHRAKAEAVYLDVIKGGFIGAQMRLPARVNLEIARKAVPPHLRPTQEEFEDFAYLYLRSYSQNLQAEKKIETAGSHS